MIGSADGTLLAVEVRGEGPPLLLLSGGSADHHNWDHVSPLLAAHFTTYGVDRRGRGASDDLSEPGGDDLAREVEDLHAIIGHVGEAVHVLAHSGGAVCALEAALQGADVRTLLLYEPPLDVSPDFPRGLADRLQAFADAGDMEGLLVTFLREGPRVPDAEITAMRASPSWQARLAGSLRILREVRLVEGLSTRPSAPASVRTSGLAARGERHPSRARGGRGLPRRRVAEGSRRDDARSGTRCDAHRA